MGTVVNNYRETEVSLQKFEEILAMPPEARGAPEAPDRGPAPPAVPPPRGGAKPPG